jgi:hypothetical protein
MMEGSFIGTVAKGWEFLYFPIEFLKGFVLGSVQYLTFADCPAEFFSDHVPSLPPNLNISTTVYLGLIVPVFTSLLFLISWAQKM